VFALETEQGFLFVLVSVLFVDDVFFFLASCHFPKKNPETKKKPSVSLWCFQQKVIIDHK